ncbi:MAG: type IV-A pilus assembly ATPase PilB [Gammaproteobacteria bacterium]
MLKNSEPKSVLSGYAYFLAEQKLLDKTVALNALQNANANKTSYIDYLVKQKLLSDAAVAQTTSEYFGLPLCDIQGINLDSIPNEYLNLQLTRRRQGLPLFIKRGLLYLAVIDPTVELLHEIRFLTGLDPRLFIVEASKLTQIIDTTLNTLIMSEISADLEESQHTVVVDTYKEESTDLEAFDLESAPVVNYVNRILMDAIAKKASDIHFEQFEGSYRIRFRQHGVLYPITSPPTKLAKYILARIKVMSDLDITEHRIPQDGRFKLIISKKRAIDFRVSVCPTLFGEKIVLRILDPSSTLQGVEQLGMEPVQQEHLLAALQHSQGLILVTGPTGSGKTVTLYTSLNFLNSTEKNISTVEDPVEIPIQGINQVTVNLKTGLTFSTALRSFLRQDPDIIMVGEIRDFETAEIAVKAAQTGHLVLSTLHTNSAPETVTRLMNMGIEPYNLASSLKIVIAQRLVRTLCNKCKKEENTPKDILIQEGFKPEEIGKFKLYEAVGCEECIFGFKGRVGIFEVMPISKEMEFLIMRGANALEIIKQAKQENISDLRESGLKKVKEGITSLAELNRVFK